MTKVVFPLAISGILTVVVFSFTLSMHEFIYALTFISVSAKKTVSIGVPTEWCAATSSSGGRSWPGR